MFEERLHPRGRGGKFAHTPGKVGDLKVTTRERNGAPVDATPGRARAAFAGGGKAGSMKPGDRFSYNGRDYDVTEASDVFGGRRRINTRQGDEFRFEADMDLDPPQVRAPGEALPSAKAGRADTSAMTTEEKLAYARQLRGDKTERVMSRDGVGAPVRDAAQERADRDKAYKAGPKNATAAQLAAAETVQLHRWDPQSGTWRPQGGPAAPAVVMGMRPAGAPLQNNERLTVVTKKRRSR